MESVNRAARLLSLQGDDRRGAETPGVRVLVIGEVLWDRFPDSTRLGGAPLNFAVNLERLGHRPLLLSAVGTDRAGEEARRAVERLGLDVSLLQVTARFRTGSAAILVGVPGDVRFTIERPAAYDAIEVSELTANRLIDWNPSWVYYGTLFPSTASSREVLLQLLRMLPNAARFYDLNVRPGFDGPELIEFLLRSADVVKLNEAELEFAHEHFGLPSGPEAFCRAGAERYGWRAACVTLGARGCAMLLRGDYVEAEGVPVTVADTVGAGDAFASAFLHGLVSGWPAAKTAEFSNRLGAYVASIHGAIPERTPNAFFRA